MPALHSTTRAIPAMRNISGDKRPQASGIRAQRSQGLQALLAAVALIVLGFSAGLEAHGIANADGARRARNLDADLVGVGTATTGGEQQGCDERIESRNAHARGRVGASAAKDRFRDQRGERRW